MNELIIFGQEIATSDTIKVLKLSNLIYQILYDIAQAHRLSLSEKQERIYKEITVHVDEHYPGWGVQTFVDLSLEDARKINQRYDMAYEKRVEWGMYILIEKGAPHTKLFTQSKQIEDGNSNDGRKRIG